MANIEQPTLFTRACRGEKTERPPVWMMRQAGRYQPEYRALKERVGGFWGLCTNPEAIAEATLFAQRSLQTDAAIIFSDITVPGFCMGVDLEFVPGPKFARPIRTAEDIEGLKAYDPHEKAKFLMDGIGLTRQGLPADVSLIGFVGAPFTVAGYMVEGYPSRGWTHIKRMVYGKPELFEALLAKLESSLVAHAKAQVEAGCDAIQLFDSTAGELAPAELQRFAFDSSRRVLKQLKHLDVPLIYFARNVGQYLSQAADVGADVIGVDWATNLSAARKVVPEGLALQGNLDPTTLFCSVEEVAKRTEAMLDQVRGQPGFVANLGHGILPETPVENVKCFADTVRNTKWG